MYQSRYKKYSIQTYVSNSDSEKKCKGCHKVLPKNFSYIVCHNCRMNEDILISDHTISRTYGLRTDEIYKGVKEGDIRWFDTRYNSSYYKAFSWYHSKMLREDVEKYAKKIMDKLEDGDIRKTKYLSTMSTLETERKKKLEAEKRREALKDNIKILALKLINPNQSDEIKYYLTTLDHPKIHNLLEAYASKVDFKLMPLSMFLLDKIEAIVDKEKAVELRRREIDSLLEIEFFGNMERVEKAQSYYEYETYVAGNSYYGKVETVRNIAESVNSLCDKEDRKQKLEDLVLTQVPKEYQEFARGCGEYNKYIYSGNLDDFDPVKNSILNYVEDEMLMNSILADREIRLTKLVKGNISKSYQNHALMTCEARFFLKYGKNIWNYHYDEDLEGLDDDEIFENAEKVYKTGENFDMPGFYEIIEDDNLETVFEYIREKIEKLKEDTLRKKKFRLAGSDWK